MTRPKDATVGPESTEPQVDAPPTGHEKTSEHVVSVGDKRAVDTDGADPRHRLTELQRKGQEPEDSVGHTKDADE